MLKSILIAFLASAVTAVKIQGTCEPRITTKQFGLRYTIDCPYNLNIQDRYTLSDSGVHSLWLKHDDKPFSSHTVNGKSPRVELAFKDYLYNSGIWQFSGSFFVPKTSTGFTLFQIFNEKRKHSEQLGDEEEWDGPVTVDGATAVMVNIHNGDLTTYVGQDMIERNAQERWIDLRVVHNYNTKDIFIYIGNETKPRVKRQAQGRGGKNHYKCGIYSKDDKSSVMKIQWKNIKIQKVSGIEGEIHYHHHHSQ